MNRNTRSSINSKTRPTTKTSPPPCSTQHPWDWYYANRQYISLRAWSSALYFRLPRTYSVAASYMAGWSKNMPLSFQHMFFLDMSVLLQASKRGQMKTGCRRNVVLFDGFIHTRTKAISPAPDLPVGLLRCPLIYDILADITVLYCCTTIILLQCALPVVQ